MRQRGASARQGKEKAGNRNASVAVSGKRSSTGKPIEKRAVHAPVDYMHQICYISGVKALHFDAYTKKDGTTPFRDFLTTLPAKDRAKLLATITKIEEHGLAEATRQQWVKHLEGEIWEIRSQFANNIQRACYFHAERDHYIITHGFTKKTQKTPRSEIRKAQTFYKLYKQEG